MCEITDKIYHEGVEYGLEEGRKSGLEEGAERERLNAVGRMIKAGATKEMIVAFGYTEEELEKAKDMIITGHKLSTGGIA